MGRAQNLLVGYGTLLSKRSVADTVGEAGRTKPFVPVIVPNFCRLFNLRPEHYPPSFRRTSEPIEVAAMNVLPSEGSHFNGLAFPVSETDLMALDKRERYYQRVRIPITSFSDNQPLGNAWVYSAGPEAPAVFDSSVGLLPHWRDVVLARQGAYSHGNAFGSMFDETTFMADGRTLVVDEYRRDLPDPYPADTKEPSPPRKG